MQKRLIVFILAIVGIILLSGCMYNKIKFDPELTDCNFLIVGEQKSCSFCTPAPQSTSDLCDSSAINPTNGNPPYHFQLDSGSGFPPMGMSLNLNGLLTGTPSKEGTYKFKVCAIDLSGNQKCKPFEIEVVKSLEDLQKELDELEEEDCEKYGICPAEKPQESDGEIEEKSAEEIEEEDCEKYGACPAEEPEKPEEELEEEPEEGQESSECTSPYDGTYSGLVSGSGERTITTLDKYGEPESIETPYIVTYSLEVTFECKGKYDGLEECWDQPGQQCWRVSATHAKVSDPFFGCTNGCTLGVNNVIEAPIPGERGGVLDLYFPNGASIQVEPLSMDSDAKTIRADQLDRETLLSSILGTNFGLGTDYRGAIETYKCSNCDGPVDQQGFTMTLDKIS